MTGGDGLNHRQWGMLLVLAHAGPPGHAAHPRNATLTALARRGLAASEPDPSRKAGARWTATLAGQAVVEARRA